MIVKKNNSIINMANINGIMKYFEENNEDISTWLCIDKGKREFCMLYNDRYPIHAVHYLVDDGIISPEREKEILDTLNGHKDDEKYVYDVIESNPYYDGCSHSYFAHYDEAEEAYNDLVDSQDGRSSFDDDEGGMDYSLDSKKISVFDYAAKYYTNDFEELMYFATKDDTDENNY